MVTIAAVIGGLVILLCLSLLAFRQLRRRCQRGRKAIQKAEHLDGFSSLLLGAETEPAGATAHHLSLLRTAAHNIVRRGDRIRSLVDEVESLINERAGIAPALSDALADEVMRKQGFELIPCAPPSPHSSPHSSPSSNDATARSG